MQEDYAASLDSIEVAGWERQQWAQGTPHHYLQFVAWHEVYNSHHGWVAPVGGELVYMSSELPATLYNLHPYLILYFLIG